MQIAICDDNKEDQKKYKRWILHALKQANLTADVTCYDSGRALLFEMDDMSRHPDVLFMDIYMPDKDGMEISKILRDETRKTFYQGEIVFLTRSSEFAIDAFDVSAAHYIVKNVTPQKKFNEIVQRVCEKSASKKKKHLLLRGNGEYRNIDVETIHYFEIYRRIITVYYGNPVQTFEFYSSMAKLEEVVLPFGFLRTYKSAIVRVGAIVSLSKSQVLLQSGERVPVGETYYPNLKRAFESQKNL